VSETEALFGVLRQSADAQSAAAIERLVRDASDRDLCRVNVLDFAATHGLNEEPVIAAFLHAARLGLFELSWNVLCPGCGGVLDASATLKTINRDEYDCELCAAGYEPTLDEMVEVTFTVSPRVRRIAAHSPDTLPEVEYYRQIFWGSGADLPETLGDSLAEFTIDSIELPPGEKAVLSVQLPRDFVIAFDPVTHGTQFIDVKGRADARAADPFDGVQQGEGAGRDGRDAARAVAAVAREPHRPPRAAGAVDRRRSAPPSAWQAQAVPHGQTASHQSDFPRHLSHRHARYRSAAQDY